MFILLLGGATAAPAAEKVAAALVKLSATVLGSARSGTGFVVAQEGDTAFVVTAAHVVAGSRAIEAEFLVDASGGRDAEVFRLDPRSDLALLRVFRRPAGTATLLVSGQSPEAGTEATVVGFPQRASAPRFAIVTVSSLEGSSLVLSGRVDSGSSGSPVLAGEVVVGLVTATDRFYPRAVPGATLRLVLAGWLSADLLGTPPEEVSGEARGQGADVAGATVFEGPVAMHDSVAVFNPTEPVTIHQARPRFFLRSDLETLSLGERSTLEIAAAPTAALADVACAWQIEPNDYLAIRGDVRSDCSLEVTMPVAPDRRYGPRVAAKVTARVTRASELVEELVAKVALANGISIIALLSGEPLTPSGEVKVVITKVGKEAPLGPDYRCLWPKSAATPFRFEAAAANDCAGRIIFKPEAELSAADLMLRSVTGRVGLPSSWSVKASYQDVPIPGAMTQFQVEIEDPRSPDDLQADFAEKMRRSLETTRLEVSQSAIDETLSQSGLPPLASLNASNLRLVAAIDSRSWELQTFYVGEDGDAEPVALDRKRGILKIEYSGDGERFHPWGYVGRSRELVDLANLDHIWVRGSTSLGTDDQVGPWRLAVDGPALLQAGLLKRWQDMGPDGRRQIACSGFAIGPGVANERDAKSLAAVVESVALRRVGGTLWRTVTYGADLEILQEDSFQRLTPPLGGADYIVRLQFEGRPTEDYECQADRRHSVSRSGDSASGLHYLLQRVSKADPAAPPAIEVFVEEDSRGEWKVFYDQAFEPAFVRFSTDGESFQTLARGYEDKNSVRIRSVEGHQLYLRFVATDGSERAYRGQLDFDQHRRTMLLGSLLHSLNPVCRSAKADAVDSINLGYDDFSHMLSTAKAEGLGVHCQILTHKGWGQRAGPIKLSRVLPILRHIQFGCARDRMDQREDFSAFRSRENLGLVFLSFGLEEPCETVFAQLFLSEDSQSEILVIPVATGG